MHVLLVQERSGQMRKITPKPKKIKAFSNAADNNRNGSCTRVDLAGYNQIHLLF
jgi:hypothetical protein